MYYSRISLQELQICIYDDYKYKTQSFISSELNLLSKYSITYSKDMKPRDMYEAIFKNNFISINNDYIYKLADEWYIVQCTNSEKYIYYKCDQMDGLLECLKYLKNYYGA